MSHRPPPPPLPSSARTAAHAPASEQATRVIDIEKDALEVTATPTPAPALASAEAAEAPGADPAASAGASPADAGGAGYRKVERRAFGRFELLIEMGHGGMATLYLARIQGPSNFEKLLAIKKIHDHLAVEEQFVRMFLDEARIAAKIHHPNVATTFEMGRIESSYFIAMEYVHGQNLTDILKATVREQSRFPWPVAARIAADAAAGLHAAHELRGTDGVPLGVVHRDVSPQNILISYDGVVKVVDFGVAYAAEKLEQTTAGTLKGKASYMSPEQARGLPIDRRTDVFALGIVLWESVCFRRLFREEHEGATLLKVRAAEVRPPSEINPEVPADLDRVILKALAREQADRYSSADELCEALEEVLLAHKKRTAPKQVAKMLEGLFRDRRELKDQQIQAALADAGASPLKGVGMRGSNTLSLATISESALMEGSATSGPAPRASRVPLIAALVAVAIAAVAVTLLVVRPSGDRPPRERPGGQASGPSGAGETAGASRRPGARRGGVAPPRRPPSRVKIKIAVTPSEPTVVVTFRGAKHVGPIFEMVVPRSDRAETIRIEAPGFAPQTLVVVPSGDTDIPVSLVALPRLEPSRAAAPPRRTWRPPPTRRRPGLWEVD